MLFGFINILVQTALFSGIYILLRFLFRLPEIILVPVVLITVLLISSHVSALFLRLRPVSRRTKQIEHALVAFDSKLNIKYEYHDLLNQFYQIFKDIFPDIPWAFYVNEENTFRLLNFNAVNSEKLPVVLNQEFSSPAALILPLDEVQKKYHLKGTTFFRQGLNRLLLLEGKSQTIAVLFLNERGLRFLKDEPTANQFYRITRKSAQLLESTALFLDVVNKNRQIRKVLEIIEKILTSLNTDEILEFLLNSVYEIVPYDAAVIFLLDEDSGTLTHKVSRGYDAEIDLNLKIGQGACGWVAENRSVSVIDDVEKAEHYYSVRPKTKSQVALPLQIHDHVLGVLCLESNEPAYFDEQSLEVLSIAAHQAAIALNNARQYEVGLTKQYLEHELIKAQHVQRVLLPQRAPAYANLNIAFEQIPSKIVSGDLIDLVPVNDKTLGLVIGDVSGKGAHAAIMMSLVLAGFRAYRKAHVAVCEVVARLNNLLEESLSDGRYATLVYMLISIEQNLITYTNAGHNAPLLFRNNGFSERLDVGGIVIGYLPNEVYSQKTISFKTGDLLVCYTDGLTEAINEYGEEFGEKRLIELIQENLSLCSYDLKDKILSEVKRFSHTSEFVDDLSIVIIKHT